MLKYLDVNPPWSCIEPIISITILLTSISLTNNNQKQMNFSSYLSVTIMRIMSVSENYKDFNVSIVNNETFCIAIFYLKKNIMNKVQFEILFHGNSSILGLISWK